MRKLFILLDGSLPLLGGNIAFTCAVILPASMGILAKNGGNVLKTAVSPERLLAVTVTSVFIFVTRELVLAAFSVLIISGLT